MYVSHKIEIHRWLVVVSELAYVLFAIKETNKLNSNTATIINPFLRSHRASFCHWANILHLFYRIFHAIRIDKYMFFSLVYSVILDIFWVTLFSKHMWGSVQVIWKILACATYRHFIYHPVWASCSEIQYPHTWWDNFFLLNIRDYFDNFLTLEGNLDHIAEDLCDTIKG